MIRIAHLVNPVAAAPTSDLRVAQPVAFESIRRAAAAAGDGLEIDLVATCLPADAPALPEGFRALPPLARSVTDVERFDVPRPLPLAADLLAALRSGTSADHVIYTNADIALMPYFYDFVGRQIDRGLDAFMINRRTIPPEPSGVADLPLMYAALGRRHPGKDCFVMHRRVLDAVDVGRVCVGVRFVAGVISTNLMAHAQRCRIFKDEHLTFHLGDDRPWARPERDEYTRYNAREARLALRRLLALPAVADRPRSRTYVERRLARIDAVLGGDA